jgi:predicted nucleic acid-binding Zn ribbon protein
MDRASKLIRGLAVPSETITAEEVVCAAWPHAVGKKIAAHTQAMRMVRTRLLVAVEDHIWQRQLFGLSAHILRNLEKSLGPGVVDDLEFRVLPRRREPQRAVEPVSGSSDEADQIADPVLRGIYRASRQKARA